MHGYCSLVLSFALPKRVISLAKQEYFAKLKNYISNKIFKFILYLVSCGVFSDKYDEDETAPEKVDASNYPEDKFSGGETLLHVPMIPMEEVLNAFKYPQNSHHSEQLAVQELEKIK